MSMKITQPVLAFINPLDLINPVPKESQNFVKTLGVFRNVYTLWKIKVGNSVSDSSWFKEQSIYFEKALSRAWVT
jgi:hypothetical protein